MNRYQNPELYERLAMEYISGNMSHLTRKRFVTLMDQYPFIAANVQHYEKKITPLVMNIEERKPSKAVWQEIEKKVQKNIKSDNNAHIENHSIISKLWHMLSHRGYMFAVVSLFVVGMWSTVNWSPITDVDSIYATVLSMEDADSAVMIEAKKDTMLLSVQMMKKIDVPEGMQLQLWCLPKEGGAVNMGAISGEQYSLALSEQLWNGLVDAAALALSYEPAGSTMDAPTGQYMYKGDLTFS